MSSQRIPTSSDGGKLKREEVDRTMDLEMFRKRRAKKGAKAAKKASRRSSHHERRR
jgi:hypothetical protein